MGMIIEKTVKVKDVPQKSPCENCKVCMRLRLLEMGFVEGQKVRMSKMQGGLWRVSFLDESENPFQSFGMREDEIDRILFEEDCSIELC